MLSCGIVGLPNVGKTTLFKALSRVSAEISNYPFTTVGKNEAILPVPDPRLEKLKKLSGQKEARPATFELVDIAGLIKGAHKGEGLGNEFLGYIRNVDALLHVVRCFENPDVVHIEGEIDPIRDIQIVDLELIFADLAIVERREHRLRAQMKASHPPELVQELRCLEEVHQALSEGKSLRHLPNDLREALKPLSLLTTKPRIIVANIGEEGENPALEKLREWAREEGEEVFEIPARLYADLADLPEKEAEEFAQELGIEKEELSPLIQRAYSLLSLVTFYTITGAYASAWAIPRGTTAWEAAGKIHTDIQKGFIRAEVIPFPQLEEEGSWHHAREHGKIRLEGRDYVVQDGDVIYFRFSG